MPNHLRKILLLLIFFILPYYFWKNADFFKEKVSVQEEISESSLLSALLNHSSNQTEIRQPAELAQETFVQEAPKEEVSEETNEEVKVMPIVISDHSTLETEERAKEFSLLKSKCPINQNNFNINFSYENDNFEVFLTKNKEEEFWQWLKVNYPKLGKDSFTIIEL